MSDELNAIKQRLDSVSPCYCPAKWRQVTVHLHTGLTHSCHHPMMHQIPIAELSRPDALHNTRHKMDQRRLMLEGQRPAECKYCWNIEDSGGTSDRILKSSEPWARDDIESLAKLPWDSPVAPTYLEVSFSNACNMACSYCAPHVSSRWQKEIEEYGPYPTFQPLNAIWAKTFEEDGNPYIKAFWQWLPTIYDQLQVLRITGGEPLLSHNTFKLLSWIKDHPSKKLDVAINTNLMATNWTFNRLVTEAASLGDRVKSLTIFTSVDGYGNRAEYIRHGMNYLRLIDHIKILMQKVPSALISLICTFNALSFFDFNYFLADVAQLKEGGRCYLDIPYLQFPSHQSVRVMPPDRFVPKMLDIIAEMERLKFSEAEISKARRILQWMMSPMGDTERQGLQADFYRFFSEHDRRRCTDILSVFPELGEAWPTWEKYASKV